MNKLFSLLFLLFISTASFSQKVYFVYLQSEPEQAFFVKMNGKIHSSTASGYLILPKLVDSSYNFTVGFPQNKWPDQQFEVAVKAKDHGYLLKNFGEKGWGLFDLQTLSVQMSAAATPKTSILTEKIEVSPFTEILSKAADDPTLKERPVVAKTAEKKPEEKVIAKAPEKQPVAETVKEQPVVVTEKAPVVVNTTAANTEAAVVKTPEAEKPVVAEPQATAVVEVKTEEKYQQSVVKLNSEYASSEGVGIVYIDEHANGLKDTINILIPSPRPAVSQAQPVKEEKRFLDISSAPDTQQTVTPVVKEEVAKPVAVEAELAKTTPAETKEVETRPTETKSTAIKPAVAKTNSCKEIAQESDFLKLRKKMAAETDDDDMVDQARKYFKTKCFTTAQIKNLGALFLDDLGKYKFFDMSYVFVADMENFASLQSELKGEYYVNRFKSMLR